MTDPDPHQLDELASAHLDGATTPEEASRVAADPALLARVESLRAVRAALQATPRPDPDRREAAIAAALAAFDEDADAPVAGVTSLAEVAARRRTMSRSWRIAGVAAAAAAVVALVPLLASQSDDDDQSAAEVSMDADAETMEGDEQTPTAADARPDDADEAGNDAAPTSTASPGQEFGALEGGPASLGEFATDADLVAAAEALEAADTASQAYSATESSGVAQCAEDVLATVPAGEPVELLATGEVAGVRTIVVLTATEVRIAREGRDCTAPRIERR